MTVEIGADSFSLIATLPCGFKVSFGQRQTHPRRSRTIDSRLSGELDPRRFFDNTLIKEVNRDYASKLFPGQVR